MELLLKDNAFIRLATPVILMSLAWDASLASANETIEMSFSILMCASSSFSAGTTATPLSLKCLTTELILFLLEHVSLMPPTTRCE